LEIALADLLLSLQSPVKTPANGSESNPEFAALFDQLLAMLSLEGVQTPESGIHGETGEEGESSGLPLPQRPKVGTTEELSFLLAQLQGGEGLSLWPNPLIQEEMPEPQGGDGEMVSLDTPSTVDTSPQPTDDGLAPPAWENQRAIQQEDIVSKPMTRGHKMVVPSEDQVPVKEGPPILRASRKDARSLRQGGTRRPLAVDQAPVKEEARESTMERTLLSAGKVDPFYKAQEREYFLRTQELDRAIFSLKREHGELAGEKMSQEVLIPILTEEEELLPPRQEQTPWQKTLPQETEEPIVAIPQAEDEDRVLNPDGLEDGGLVQEPKSGETQPLQPKLPKDIKIIESKQLETPPPGPLTPPEGERKQAVDNPVPREEILIQQVPVFFNEDGLAEEGELLEKVSLPPEVKEQLETEVVRQVGLRIEEGSQEIRLVLHPRELGDIRLKVVAKDGQISTQFLVENQSVKAVMESAVPQLRQALSEQGLQLTDFSVDIGGQGTFSGQEQEGQPRFYHHQPRAQRAPLRQDEGGGYGPAAHWSLGQVDLQA
jgi:hypothetical protein